MLASTTDLLNRLLAGTKVNNYENLTTLARTAVNRMDSNQEVKVVFLLITLCSRWPLC